MGQTTHSIPPQGLSPGARDAVGQVNSQPPGPSAVNRRHFNEPFIEALKVFGVVPMEFWSSGRGRVVMLIVLDPKRVADHMAAAMGVIDLYEKMPALVRVGMDQSTKKLVGFSASDLTNANTPVGMIVYAARNWKDEDTRAIILVDANRQPNPLPTPHDD